MNGANYTVEELEKLFDDKFTEFDKNSSINQSLKKLDKLVSSLLPCREPAISKTSTIVTSERKEKVPVTCNYEERCVAKEPFIRGKISCSPKYGSCGIKLYVLREFDLMWNFKPKLFGF